MTEVTYQYMHLKNLVPKQDFFQVMNLKVFKTVFPSFYPIVYFVKR